MFDMSDVKAFDRADYGLYQVRVAQWGCLVFVTLDDDLPDLATWLGDVPERLGGYSLAEWQPAASRTYDIGANWKFIAENFMEYYHLPWVHPELMKVSRMEDHYRFQGPGMYTGMTTSPVSRADNDVWLALPPHDGVTGSDLESGRFILLFPNDDDFPAKGEIDIWEGIDERVDLNPMKTFLHRANPLTGIDETLFLIWEPPAVSFAPDGNDWIHTGFGADTLAQGGRSGRRFEIPDLQPSSIDQH